MRSARCTISATTALVMLTLAAPGRAQLPPAEGSSPPPPASADGVTTRPSHDGSKLYPVMQVVGASLFGVSYGWAFIGAMLLPGPGVEREQEKIATRLMVPVVGPWWATAHPLAPRIVTIPLGILQGGGVVLFTWGLVGALLDDEDRPEDSAITVSPLSPDGTRPGLGVAGRF
jgi:hypothetical protein